MARIERIDLSPVYNDLRERSDRRSETNDCAVVAISVVTGFTYEKCHLALAAQGRKQGSGTYRHQQRAALEYLGFKIMVISFRERCEIIDSYPGIHSTLKNITSHHPRRFPASFHRFGDSLWFTQTHVSAFKDGRLHDWAENRALRITEIWKVTKA